jgi:4-hydroxybenzoate polyprenyltransferase
MAMTVSMAFANIITKEIILLGVCCALVYSAVGIHNAIKDHDYELPSYANIVMILMPIAAIVVSLSHYLLFITVLAWIALGLAYNTAARHILFGDTTILAVTHFALPSLMSSLILGLDLKVALPLSVIFFLIAWFITLAKNLKDIEEDKKRHYITLTTRFKNGVFITQMLMFIPFVVMLFAFFVFNLTPKFILVMVAAAFLTGIAIIKISKNQEKESIGILRLVFLVFMLGLIVEKTANYGVILLGVLLCLAYVVYLAALHSIMVKKWTLR